MRGGSDAWNKFEDITHECFSYQCGATCTAKDRHGVRQSLVVFFCEDVVGFHLQEFRTTLASMGSWDQAMSQQITEKEKEYMHHGPFEDVSQIRNTRELQAFIAFVGVPEDMNFKSFPSIRLRFWQGNALASAEQPPVAAPLGWEAVTLRWELGCWDRSPCRALIQVYTGDF